MSRRGARRITVDGHQFRWKLNAESPDTLAVLVEPDGGRALLEVQLPGELYHGAVTPRLVEDVVRAAVTAGWVPEGSQRGQLWRWESGGLQRIR